MAEIEISVRKHSAVIWTAVDTDGTPMEHGERMVEVEPGRWVSPWIAAAEAFLAPHVAALGGDD